MYNRKAFKKEAKELMRTSKPHYMLVALVYVLLTTGLSYAVTFLTDVGGVVTGAISVFLNILVGLFSMVVAVGFANYTLRLSRKESTGMGSLFESFSFAGRSIGVRLLVAVYIFLWSLLILVAYGLVVGVVAVVAESIPVLIGIVAGVLYIAVIVLLVAVALRYVMADFALVENPDGGAGEAIRRSVRMMKGHKGKFFVLQLSFIGWSLLIALIGLIVLGVGVMVSGTGWLFESFAAAGSDPMAVYELILELMGQLSIWTILAEVLALPLTMWLLVYQQTTCARFYNFVGGYDYHQYMNGDTAERQAIPVEVSAEEPEQPGQPTQTPPGGYYTPAPKLDEPTAEPEDPADEEEI